MYVYKEQWTHKAEEYISTESPSTGSIKMWNASGCDEEDIHKPIR
jgi:hypothetical protein